MNYGPTTLQYWRVQPPIPTSPQYSHLTIDELLKLAGETTSLTPEAAALLRHELDRRCLTDQDVQAHRLEEAEVQSGFLNDSLLRFFRAAIFFFGHLTILTLGVGIAAAMLFYAFKPVLSPFLSPFSLRHNLPLMIPLFPIQSIVALVVGFAIARKKGQILAPWKCTVGMDRSDTFAAAQSRFLPAKFCDDGISLAPLLLEPPA